VNDATAERLARALKSNGTAILEDRDSLQRLLAPGTAQVPDDVRALLVLLDTKGVAHLMKWASADLPNKPKFAQMRDHMAAKYAKSGILSAELASWGLDAWMRALPSLRLAAKPTHKSMELEPMAPPPPPPPPTEPASPLRAGSSAIPVASASATASTVENPYAAPRAHVEDVPEPGIEAGMFVENGRTVPAGNGWQWIVDGWRLFARQPLMWWGVLLVFVLLTVGVQIIPFAGPLIGTLIAPVLYAGLMLGAHALRGGDRLTFGHVFGGFRERTGALILLAVLQTLAIIVAVVVLWLLFGASLAALSLTVAAQQVPTLSMFVSMSGLIIAAFVLFTPIFIVSYLAPPLVAIDGLSAPAAFKTAIVGGFRNVLSGTVYGLAMLVAMVIATIPIGLGWIVLLPVAVASIYAAYDDIFHLEPSDASSRDSSRGAKPAASRRLARTLTPASNVPVPPAPPGR
jgi:hypothetical protein